MTKPTPPPPSLHLNWEDWLPYFADSDATDDEKRQMIEALWSIVTAFVDLGWDDGPEPESCGQTFDLKAALAAAVVQSEKAQTEEEAV